MKIAWLSKRHYTHKDALTDKYGRVYQLPLRWSESEQVTLELIDYYGRTESMARDGALKTSSTPFRSSRAMARMIRRIQRMCPDVIVASGDCFIGLLGLWLCRKCDAKFVFDVYDDYRKFGAYRLFLGFNAFEFLQRKADLVLFASTALAMQGNTASNWSVVPNGVDPALFKPIDRATARARVGIANDQSKWIGYFGGMDAERGSEDLVTAVGMLHAIDPDIRLLLCGKPIGDKMFGQPWVDFRGQVAHERIPDFINACDVVALPYRSGPLIDMAASCKISEYLWCRKPLVATRTPNLLTNFPDQARELTNGLCEPGNPEDLARALNYQLRSKRVASIPRRHAWKSIADDTLAAVAGVMGRATPGADRIPAQDNMN